MSDRQIELAEELAVIIYNLSPFQLQDFLSEIQWAIDNEILPNEYDEDWFVDADWYDVALCCISTGATFDNGEVMDFLYKHIETRRTYMSVDIYGRKVERRVMNVKD